MNTDDHTEPADDTGHRKRGRGVWLVVRNTVIVVITLVVMCVVLVVGCGYLFVKGAEQHERNMNATEATVSRML